MSLKIVNYEEEKYRTLNYSEFFTTLKFPFEYGTLNYDTINYYLWSSKYNQNLTLPSISNHIIWTPQNNDYIKWFNPDGSYWGLNRLKTECLAGRCRVNIKEHERWMKENNLFQYDLKTGRSIEYEKNYRIPNKSEFTNGFEFQLYINKTWTDTKYCTTHGFDKMIEDKNGNFVFPPLGERMTAQKAYNGYLLENLCAGNIRVKRTGIYKVEWYNKDPLKTNVQKRFKGPQNNDQVVSNRVDRVQTEVRSTGLKMALNQVLINPIEIYKKQSKLGGIKIITYEEQNILFLQINHRRQ